MGGVAARGHLERSGDDRRAFTAGILLPGIFVNRPTPEEVPRSGGVRSVVHRCCVDEATTRGADYYHEGKHDQ